MRWTLSTRSGRYRSSLAPPLRPTTSKPVFAVPHPIVPPSVPPGIDRTALGLQEDCTLFLFCFDLLSLLERKNPLGLIEAYSRAFEADGGATLVLKVINGDQRLPDLERLRLAVADRPDIMLIDRYLDAERARSAHERC